MASCRREGVGELPALQQVHFEYCHDRPSCRIVIDFYGARDSRMRSSFEISDMELMHELPQRRDTRTVAVTLREQAERIWSAMVEDEIVERECEQLRLALDNAQRIGAPPDIIMMLQQRLHERRQHVRQEQFERRAPEEAPPYEVWHGHNRRVVQRRETAAEVQLRRQQMQHEMQRLRLQDEQYRAEQAGAEKKGLDLFMANLTPEQKASYEKHKCIEVTGGKSGKRYRINHGRSQNIHELDNKGNVTTGWCFLPRGQLVTGDVMLAQKTALELYEDKALKIANRFHAGTGRGRNAGLTDLIVNTLAGFSEALADNIAAHNPLLRSLGSRREANPTFQLRPADLTRLMHEFRSATDATGQLRHPRFDEVRQRMGQVMASDPVLARMPDGPNKLRVAYDMAIRERGPQRPGDPTPTPRPPDPVQVWIDEAYEITGIADMMRGRNRE